MHDLALLESELDHLLALCEARELGWRGKLAAALLTISSAVASSHFTQKSSIGQAAQARLKSAAKTATRLVLPDYFKRASDREILKDAKALRNDIRDVPSMAADVKELDEIIRQAEASNASSAPGEASLDRWLK